MDAATFCTECGNRLDVGIKFCSKCGAKVHLAASPENPSQEIRQPSLSESSKSSLMTLLLCAFFGILGLHRFYVGKIFSGLFMFLTAGGLGVWVLIDLILIVTNRFEDKEGRLLILTNHPSSFKKTVMVIGSIIAWGGMFGGLIVGMVFYLTSGLVDTIHYQLYSLQSDDLKKAYSYTSKDFQKATSLNDFKNFLDNYPSLKNNKSVFFNERIIENNIGTVKGTLTAKDGAKTPIEYSLIKEDGSWKILRITVMPTGAGVKINKQSIESSHSLSNKDPLLSVFEDKNNRYAIKYPREWEYVKPEKGTIVFSGKNGSQAYYATVNIQTVLAKKTGGKYSNLTEFMDSFKQKVMALAPDVKVLDKGDMTLPTNPKRFQGQYLIFTYTYKNQLVKQMQVVIFRDDALAFYTWAYTAPMDQYNTFLPIAKVMYESWMIN